MISDEEISTLEINFQVGSGSKLPSHIAIQKLISDIRELKEWMKMKTDALEDVFKMLDEEILVRNIDADHKDDFILRMTDFIARLGKISEASMIGSAVSKEGD